MKLHQKIFCKGILAVTKSKMRASFGAACESALIEGEVIGRSGDDKVEVKWTSLIDQPIKSYNCHHKVWKGAGFVVGRKRARKDKHLSISTSQQLPKVSAEDVDGDIIYSKTSCEKDDEMEQEQSDQGSQSILVGENVWKENPTMDAFDCAHGLPVYQENARTSLKKRLCEVVEYSALDYWKLMMPSDFLDNIVAWSNAHKSDPKDCWDVRDLKLFIATMYSFTLQPEKNIRDHWRVEDDGMIAAGRFGEKLGLSYGKFAQIRKDLKFEPPKDNSKGFECVKYLFESYNQQRERILTPGPYIVLDESTIEWNGKSEKMPTGPPHLCHMKNKPVPVSFLVKNVADAQTGMFFHLELQEGKTAMADKEFSDKHPLYTTACILRGVKALFGTGRCIIFDGWFTTLRSMIALREHGLFSVGIVKNGHAGTPAQLLKQTAFNKQSSRGATKTMHLERPEGRYICVAWNEPGYKEGRKEYPPKIFLGNIFSSVAVPEWEKK